jgi:hypothetical protein
MCYTKLCRKYFLLGRLSLNLPDQKITALISVKKTHSTISAREVPPIHPGMGPGSELPSTAPKAKKAYKYSILWVYLQNFNSKQHKRKNRKPPYDKMCLNKKLNKFSFCPAKAK